MSLYFPFTLNTPPIPHVTSHFICQLVYIQYHFVLVSAVLQSVPSISGTHQAHIYLSQPYRLCSPHYHLLPTDLVHTLCSCAVKIKGQWCLRVLTLATYFVCIRQVFISLLLNLFN